ncbi:MAG: N-acetylmuramic acid 6-phosphate etherase [Candidatus Marinimicrobia bacterium]|jgi:N-acetylmuramic acid 6-phosphate etherase|nr:N-acetylmuramic acid 6-phosphate etherase [Candidatus Neomarinimicrobiota bacterium]MDP6613733.1 N-acetylmuramic acid 6-phosphate etherase [Candidatus Neomarinimicrobiota bacterium]MDP6820460.1 N-acetylmuramic acid 6-phosphate etherase [Candidatus Neomarinimicrobiota bacterium]|tara:strand:+ start:3829 stop:4722 length:894 start_codon:yes stop_codon:yes gene_type:complete
MKSRGDLNTEQQNTQSLNIDSVSVEKVLQTINQEDQTVAQAVKKAIPEIESVVHLTTGSMREGGRVFYIGAGTSGRLGVLDASEIPPTYSAPEKWFIGIIAGGDRALRKSIEGAEDQPESAVKDLDPFGINDKDVVIGISCSGAAAYVVSALEYARKLGAKTVYLVTNPDPYKMAEVDIVIVVDTGPEIITGSTRMKAGTATKMVLNMISTATMVQLGKVYGNLMVDLMAVNEKLIDRGVRIIIQLTGLDRKDALERLKEAKMSVKKAVVMETKGIPLQETERLLEKVKGSLRQALV